MEAQSEKYQFTNNCFEFAKPVFEAFLGTISITNLLEIGSFEGQSTCYFIEKFSKNGLKRLTCIDTWTGGHEHRVERIDMDQVYSRFLTNINLSISNHLPNLETKIMQGKSLLKLAELLNTQGQELFDFTYIDGSHEAPDVIADCILTFNMTKVGGIIALDDYAWCPSFQQGKDLAFSPKVAIDSFVNIFFRKLDIIFASNKTWIIQKISD